eukprot:jgi/Botrbrau1/8673/Bobra.0087s0026.1
MRCLDDKFARLGASIASRFALALQDFREDSGTEALGLNSSDLIHRLIKNGFLEVADFLAGKLGRFAQVTLVEECERQQREEHAVHAVRKFHLEEQFPELAERIREVRLLALVRKHKWGLAARLAAEQPRLQEMLVQSAVAAGHMQAAQEYGEQFGVPVPAPLTPSSLPLPDEAIWFVDTEARGPLIMQLKRYKFGTFRGCECSRYKFGTFCRCECSRGTSLVHSVDVNAREAGVEAAAAILKQASKVGMDLEWPPQMDRKGKPRPNLLQLGCSLADDVAGLARAVPSLQSVAHAGLLDLRKPFIEWLGEEGGRAAAAGGVKKAGEVGLRTMCAATLGRELNKEMQVSDWGRRPLSIRQLQYAALDAYALLMIHDVISVQGTGLLPLPQTPADTRPA